MRPEITGRLSGADRVEKSNQKIMSLVKAYDGDVM